MTGTVERVLEPLRNGPRALQALFAPRGIAVIGASRNPEKLGSAMSRSLALFPGTVVGINRGDVDVTQRRYGSVQDAVAAEGTPIDLAVLCVPASVSAAGKRMVHAATRPRPRSDRVLRAGRGPPGPSRSSRSSSAATTSPSSPVRTPARWPPRGARPAPLSKPPARCWSTTSASSWTPPLPCRSAACVRR